MTEKPEYKTDAAGRLVPIANVKAEHLLEEELVMKLTAKAEKLNKAVAEFKAECFADVDAFLSLLAEKYGTQRRGTKGNFTLSSYDGDYRVQIAVGDQLTFGPELQVAKEIIDECLTDWAKGGNPNLRAIVTDAFDVGKEGKLRVDRILALRRIAIDDARWMEAMQAIGDALRVAASSRYVRFYRKLGGAHAQTPLDIAKV